MKTIKEQLDGIRAFMEAAIAEHGWYVQKVLDVPNFAYTVGLTETFGHPELLMVGLHPDMMQRLLNDIGKLIRSGERFSNWSRSDRVIRGYDVVFRTAPLPKGGNGPWRRTTVTERTAIPCFRSSSRMRWETSLGIRAATGNTVVCRAPCCPSWVRRTAEPRTESADLLWSTLDADAVQDTTIAAFDSGDNGRARMRSHNSP